MFNRRKYRTTGDPIFRPSYLKKLGLKTKHQHIKAALDKAEGLLKLVSTPKGFAELLKHRREGYRFENAGCPLCVIYHKNKCKGCPLSTDNVPCYEPSKPFFDLVYAIDFMDQQNTIKALTVIKEMINASLRKRS